MSLFSLKLLHLVISLHTYKYTYIALYMVTKICLCTRQCIVARFGVRVTSFQFLCRQSCSPTQFLAHIKHECMYAYMHIYIYMRVCGHMYHMCVCIYVHTHTYIHAHVCVHVYIHKCICIYILYMNPFLVQVSSTCLHGPLGKGETLPVPRKAFKGFGFGAKPGSSSPGGQGRCRPLQSSCFSDSHPDSLTYKTYVYIYIYMHVYLHISI